MIERRQRAKLARALLDYLDGRLTNFDLDDVVCEGRRSDDGVVRELAKEVLTNGAS